MRTIRLAVPIALVALTSLAIAATTRRPGPPPSPTLADSPVAKLVGEWEGVALVTIGPGEPLRIRQTERVEWRLHKNAIVIEGLGEVENPTDDMQRRGFAALAVVTANERAGTLNIDAFKLGAGHASSEFEILSPNSCRWTLRPAPGITTRMTINIDADTWTEVGETSTDDGATWHETINMTLHRKGG